MNFYLLITYLRKLIMRFAFNVFLKECTEYFTSFRQLWLWDFTVHMLKQNFVQKTNFDFFDSIASFRCLTNER